MKQRHPHPLPGVRTGILLALWTLVLYGRHLADGYVGDDFLFLHWARDGLGELLRRFTVDSTPQMIRPLPALGWLLERLPGGSVLHHGVGLGLHAASGWLIARLVARRTAAPRIAGLSGALFVAFPLFTEPVIWASAAPDLWACALALGALEAAAAVGSPVRACWAAGGLFALALACKASVLALPAIAWLAVRGARRARLTAVLAAVALAYLGLRLAIFHGLGGYLDPAGGSLAWATRPLLYLRNAILQLPLRVLMGIRGEPTWAFAVAAAQGVLWMAIAAAARSWRHPAAALLPAICYLLALLPVATIFSVNSDHNEARLAYFPVAVLFATWGGLWRDARRLTPALLAILAVLWGGLTLANGRAWSAAASEAERTLAMLPTVEARFPPGSTIYVAAPEVRDGVPVFLNGFFAARARADHRSRLRWRLGTLALEPSTAGLGVSLFEIGLTHNGRKVDWTPCQQALRGAPASLARATAADLASGTAPLTDHGQRHSGWLELGEPTRAPVVELRFAPGSAFEGRLFWRTAPHERFGKGASRRFAVPRAAAQAVVRLDARAAVSRLLLRVTAPTPAAAERLSSLAVLAAPPVCDPETAPGLQADRSAQ